MTSIENKHVAFTGRLASMPRDEAWEAIRSAGGIPCRNVTHQTDILVIGMEGWPLLPDGTVSRKLSYAEKLRAQGYPVRIISEMEFLEITGRSEHRAELQKSYPARQVCEILNISPDTLARWEQFGLIRSVNGNYDFQDLISVRTIAALVAQGVQPVTIAKSLHELASVLSVERPLAQLKIVLENPRILLAAIDDQRIAPNGQLVLDFEGVGVRARSVLAPVRLVASNDTLTAEDWFHIGGMCEDEERYADAVEAYRRAISLRPDYAEAFFNLGNVMRATGDTADAQDAYQAAVACDPHLHWAWYNLADIQEETGRLRDAVASLERAVAISPTYADAHFNLARCYERIGRVKEAKAHWTAYLRLDPHSEWARIARQRLRSLAIPVDPA